jgi:hypothetical protein
MTNAPCALAVMSKAPQAGRVKTRLAPPLTAEEAKELSACFLRDVTENIRQVADSAGFVAYTPAGTAALFDGMLAPETGLILADGEIAAAAGLVGIGRSLVHAAAALFGQGFRAVCLINADSPTLPTSFLRDAVAALLRPGKRMVLGPADDGGYYLIGLQTVEPRLFEGIAWSTAAVAGQTLARARDIGLEAVLLPPWFDVDDGPSMARLLRPAPQPADAVPFAAPATRAWLAASGLAERVAVLSEQ